MRYPTLTAGTAVRRTGRPERGMGIVTGADDMPDYYMVRWPANADNPREWESSVHVSVLTILQ